MKNFIKALFFIIIPIQVHAQKNIDLFIWAGQSNAQGYTGDAKEYPKDEQGLDKSILLNWTVSGHDSSNGEWVTMQAQKGRYPAGHFGPEVSFARQLKVAGYNPAIFKYTRGGTGLARDWKAPGEQGIYDHMVKDLKKAIDQLEKEGYVVKVHGFVWIQGETDAGDEQEAEMYQSNLNHMIDHLRNDVLAYDDLKIILGVDEQHYLVEERPIVVVAQQKIAQEDVNIIYTTMYGLPKADKTHLTPAGLVEHGNRIYKAFKVMESERSLGYREHN
ncbi:sialate O-acetylesterase [Echinicola shivajiensis]|uniref:sialate O-acetylesterase n=1 Tax=Echinicola shivajiensis TaxID=1035916 RepID=UPI001BFCBB13|nr:sialate O-acetylesterase [Echinicola shivajiensis]